MKVLATLLALALLAPPASAMKLASESTYAANNPIKHTDTNGMLLDGMPSREARHDIQSHPEVGAAVAVGTVAIVGAALAAGAGGVGMAVMSALPAEAVPAAAAIGAAGTGVGLALADQGGPSAGRAVDAAADSASAAGRAVGNTADELAAAGNKLSNEAVRGIRSYENRIREHASKLEEFMKNPTVRPGMEKLSKELIEKQQQTRIQHLLTEIVTFKANIEKLKSGDKK